jgi:ATP-binding cassette, subfamily B, bacterial CvaB/MchF/RaxB
MSLKIFQSEASECGLACLAMVANAHGHEVELTTLRRRFPMSMKGATLKQLLAIADALHFNTRALRCNVDDLAQIATPAILHWNLNHFVVFSKIIHRFGKAYYLILDPARGEVECTREEISECFTGVVVECIPAQTFERKREAVRLRIKQLWTRIFGLKRFIIHILGLSLLMQLFSLAGPFYFQAALDEALPTQDKSLLLTLAVGFLFIEIFHLVAGLLREWSILLAGTIMSRDVITNLLHHMLHLPLQWFTKRHIGDIVSRFSSSHPIVDLFTHGLVASAIDGVMAILTLILLFYYMPSLAVLALCALALYVSVRFLSLATVQRMNANVLTSEAQAQSIFMESVRGIQTIKLFGREADRQRIWLNRYVQFQNASLKLGRVSIGFGALSNVITAMENIIFVFLAVKLAMANEMTIGMIFAFQAYKSQFMSAALGLVEQYINFKILDVHMARIADIALEPREPEQVAHISETSVLQGKIELKNIKFSYSPYDPPVLRGIDLKIAAGETVAIVGQSGCGKSTLIKIILDLYMPSRWFGEVGEIFVDDLPLAKINRRAYRRQVGAVMQDDVLFAGSIAENIAFFDADIDMTRVQAAAHTASIHDEIIAMTMGYESLVGDMGSALSGGQKQRVLLARALYHQPRLLVLDEGTAHLDVETEAKVSAAIAALNITRIIVAHRPETIRTADRVLLLENGKIREIDPSPLVLAAE